MTVFLPNLRGLSGLPLQYFQKAPQHLVDPPNGRHEGGVERFSIALASFISSCIVCCRPEHVARCLILACPRFEGTRTAKTYIVIDWIVARGLDWRTSNNAQGSSLTAETAGNA